MPARYPLNLPIELKREAERLAKQQGISLNQFILWSVSQKVAEMKTGLDDPAYPHITYRRGAAGIPTPVIRGTGIRVQTIANAHHLWGESEEKIAEEYGRTRSVVSEALEFYDAHREEIDLHIRLEDELEKRHGESEAPS